MRKIFICAAAALFAFNAVAQELNVASFNIRQGRSLRPDQELPKKGDYSKYNGWDHRRDILCDMVNFEAFDVFGVQEARYGQISDMLKRMPDYDYIGVGRDDGEKKGEHCAIFYRKEAFKVLDQGTFWLSETPQKVSFGWGAKHRRICSWGLFQHKQSKKIFYFLNLHLDHRVEAAQLNGSKLVVDFVKKHCTKSSNIIITGDYNVNQSSESYDIFADSGLKDSYDIAKHRFAPTGTFNGFNPRRYTTHRIDHIFLSKGIKVSRYGVLTYHYFRTPTEEEVAAKEEKFQAELAKNPKKKRPGGENRDAKCISDHYAVQAFITLKGGSKNIKK